MEDGQTELVGMGRGAISGLMSWVEAPAGIRALTGLRDGHHWSCCLTRLHVNQQVGETANPGGESRRAALGVVGGIPALQVLIQQPPQRAGAVLVWRLRKNKAKDGLSLERGDVELNKGQRTTRQKDRGIGAVLAGKKKDKGDNSLRAEPRPGVSLARRS